ncbi:hypothetical protein LXL01_00120, partial [Klebsiella pneumoniae]|uniref:hypothetical protein n=1 Tax=Klebsiella pneumoniae TaxID=573 RepID=UPI001F480661
PVKAKLKEQVLVTALLQASYLGSSSRKLFEPKRKPPRKGGFFRSQPEAYGCCQIISRRK